MNTNTLYFRGALTVAAIWIVAFAYLTYSDYRIAYRSPEHASYSIPEEETDRCRSTMLDVTKQDFVYRERTSEEQSACYTSAIEGHRRQIKSDNWFALQQAWKSFGWKGAFPALLLLAVVAFWAPVSTGASRAGSGYLNWLRFGSNQPNSVDTDNET